MADFVCVFIGSISGFEQRSGIYAGIGVVGKGIVEEHRLGGEVAFIVEGHDLVGELLTKTFNEE